MSYRAVIDAVAHAVPDGVVTNEDLAKRFNTSDDWIRERTGIAERRFVNPGGTSAELGVLAAHRAIANLGIDKNSIDLIIAATLSPEYHFPGIGVQLQHALGLPHIAALDIRTQCTGLVYGLATADAFIRSGQATTVLLVCAEVQSTYLNFSDEGRDTAVLFGDGAGALILRGMESSRMTSERGIIDSLLCSDGSGIESLCMRMPQPEEFRSGAPGKGWHPHMDGKQVFKNAVSRMYEAGEQILQKNGFKAADVSLVIPHQANLRINEMVRERLGIPAERAFNNIQSYGNTTAATIPIALSEALAAGKLRTGDLVMTLAFGAGFTWGANLIRW